MNMSKTGKIAVLLTFLILFMGSAWLMYVKLVKGHRPPVPKTDSTLQMHRSTP